MAATESSSSDLGPRDFTGWFTETEAMWKGQRFCIQVERVLYHKRSKYQDILVFDSVSWGRVLVLDGVINLTTRDEAAYQEMMAHVPLFAHKNPERVLIIGGGDGGVLREVVRHGKVSQVTLCEIDKDVIEVAKEYFSELLGTAFDDPMVEIRHMDGAEFLSKKENEFDVIIVDSSDPATEDSPARSLYSERFFGLCATALRREGVLCIQGECPWIPHHLKLVKEALGCMQKRFGITDYGVINIPTYPCGQIGMILGCKATEDDVPKLKDRELFFRKPRRHLDLSMEKGPLKYYDEYVHEASFALPSFVRKELTDVTCANFIASSDLPEGLPTPEEFYMLFYGMLGAGLVVGALIGRFALTRLF